MPCLLYTAPIVWMNQLEFTTDPMVVDSLESADTRAGRTYTIRIVDGPVSYTHLDVYKRQTLWKA